MKTFLFIVACMLDGSIWGYWFVPEIQEMIRVAQDTILFESVEYSLMETERLAFLMVIVGLGIGIGFGILFHSMVSEGKGIFSFFYAVLIIPMILIALSVLIVLAIVFSQVGLVFVGVGIFVLFAIIKLVFSIMVI